MKLKLTLAIAFIGLALTIGLIRTSSKVRHKQTPQPTSDRLKWHVEEAKREEVKEVFLQAPTSDYLGSDITDFKEALSSYTLVVAQLEDSKTYEVEDGNNLITWNKFRTTDQLSDIRPSACNGCVTTVPPDEFLPLHPGEFCVSRRGGMLMHDGVKITQVVSDFPFFEKGQKYFMFISLYPSGVAITAGGPNGVFPLDEHGRLSQFAREPNEISNGVQGRFKNSINIAKSQLKRPE
jgi:hypothetical protein